MNELHTDQYEENSGLLCGKKAPLSKVTLDALEELGFVLKSIHNRMVAEGYEIVDGEVRKMIPQNVNVYEKVQS